VAKIKIFIKVFSKIADSLNAVSRVNAYILLFLASIMIIWLSMDNFNLNSNYWLKIYP
jgi:hypothetical protein